MKHIEEQDDDDHHDDADKRDDDDHHEDDKGDVDDACEDDKDEHCDYDNYHRSTLRVANAGFRRERDDERQENGVTGEDCHDA